MVYVITNTCIKDPSVQKCARPIVSIPKGRGCFRGGPPRYIDSEELHRLRHRVPACTSDSVHALADVPEDKEDKKDFIVKNVAFFKA